MDVAEDLAMHDHSSRKIVIARSQTKGRGRPGHSWESIDGNLHLSAIIDKPINPFVQISKLTKMLAERLGKVQAIGNDLFHNQNKIGGIIIETSEDKPYAILGIGINTNHNPKIEKRTTSLKKLGHIDSTTEVLHLCCELIQRLHD